MDIYKYVYAICTYTSTHLCPLIWTESCPRKNPESQHYRTQTFSSTLGIGLTCTHPLATVVHLHITYRHGCTCIYVCVHIYVSEQIFIRKVVKICLGVSVNLVYEFKGKPGTTTVKYDFNHLGLKFHRGSPCIYVGVHIYVSEQICIYDTDICVCIYMHIRECVIVYAIDVSSFK